MINQEKILTDKRYCEVADFVNKSREILE